jgi:hypothetical protein
MSQLCTGLFHAGVLCVISAAISAADATSAEGQPEQAGAVAVTTDELDHVCAAWGCDCQFATDAYGLNVLGRLHGKKPRTPVEDDVNKWWSENNRCAGFEPTHGSVRAYNWSPLYKADQWRPEGVKRCWCDPKQHWGSVHCCPKPGLGCSKLEALRTRMVRGGIVGIIHFHARKAGGTSTSHFFESVAKEMGWKFHDFEGYRIGADTMDAAQRAGYLVVGSFREPVERALSAYDYEERWGGIAAIGEGERTYNNTVPIAKWVHKWINESMTYPAESHGHAHEKLWSCCCNCFVGWWGTTSKSTLSKVVGRVLDMQKANGGLPDVYTSLPTLERAIAAVRKFDLLLEMGSSQVHNVNATVHKLLDIFGVSHTSQLRHEGMKQVQPYLNEWQVMSNGRLPYNVTDEEWSLMQRSNTEDSVLYRIAHAEWTCRSGHAGAKHPSSNVKNLH